MFTFPDGNFRSPLPPLDGGGRGGVGEEKITHPFLLFYPVRGLRAL